MALKAGLLVPSRMSKVTLKTAISRMELFAVVDWWASRPVVAGSSTHRRHARSLGSLALANDARALRRYGSLAPLRIQKGQVGIERALPCPEDIRTLTATDLANEFTAVSCSTDYLLEWHCVSDERMMAAFVCLRRRYPSYCSLSAQVGSFGLIVVAPIAMRITCMERRTALTKAALAFSIRCQRSATWTASGSAFAAASP
jgi:hypothetical protein